MDDQLPVTPTAPAPPVPLTAPPAVPAAKESEPNYQDAYWEHYAREIELEKEVAELGGMEKIENGEVKVPEDVAKQMGISPTVTIDTPIAQATDLTVRGVSLTDDQLKLGLSKPVSSGLRWLVEWFIYQLLKIFRARPSLQAPS